MKRRSFLQLLAAEAVGAPLTQKLASANGTYQVGVGASSDPYSATQRAVAASGQFPAAALAGKTVMIKPNLVEKQPSTSGATTDPQVVRAVVDLCLAANAAQVLVVEGGIGLPGNFQACGYSFFSSYDSRVQLMDFGTEGVSFVRVPNGVAYFGLYLPTPAVQPGVVFISVGKLKTHVNTHASLTTKNMFGLASPVAYYVPGKLLGRMDGHIRGIDQAAVDVNLVCPISYSVIDGIWGMEGNGPLTGTPINTNVVLAGLNPIAVDRVALDFMQIPQASVPHLAYAYWWGLGPANTNSVTLLGDSFTPVPFVQAQVPPTVWRPYARPNQISLAAGQSTTISYTNSTACGVNVDIIQDPDIRPKITVVRTLKSYAPTPAGVNSIQWDGRDDNGVQVAPGIYMARLMSTTGQGVGYATGWIFVGQ